MTTQRMDIEIVLDERSHGSVKLNGEEVGGRVRSVQLFGTAEENTYVVLVEVETEEVSPPAIGS